jgi:type II restriction/modification system DNA methylase subunit YeeA
MNRTKLKNYAPQARRDFIQAVTDRAAFYGLTAKKTEPVIEKGDTVLIGGRAYPRAVGERRKGLEERVRQHGFEQTMEALAYTWFNRLVAIRFMELHGYLDHGYRVLSHPEGKPTPQILEQAEHVELPGLDTQKVIDLKIDGTREEELYRLLLIAQCNALHSAMPFLFEQIDDETELVLPENLLHSDSLIRKLVSKDSIDKEDWQKVEIIGWLYQFCISEKKDEVIGKVVASEDIPAATQLFTPNWIVKYLVENTLGRQWLATYPHSALRAQMKYYIEPAEQTPEVQEQLKAITPTSLNPEELTLLDPACGSGHILVEAYDLFKAIYQERGYRAKDIPALILKKNLFGLEIDDRAAQLAAFALMMKARADERRIFTTGVQPNVLAIQESKGLNAAEITHALNSPINKEDVPSDYLFEEIEEEKAGLFSKKALAEKGYVSQGDIAALLELFENAKTFGSLIQVPPKLTAKLPVIDRRLDDVLKHGDLSHASAHVIKPLLQQARLLAKRYDAVVANPPYMGARSGMNPLLKEYVNDIFPLSKSDLYAIFIEQNNAFAKPTGSIGMVTMHGWMFLSTFEEMRQSLLTKGTIHSLAHLGPRAFGAISGEVVQVAAFAISKVHFGNYRPILFRLVDGDEEQKQLALFRRQCAHTDSTLDDFQLIPGSPIAYWASRKVIAAFQNNPPIESFSTFKQGMATSDNGRFLRLWHEVSICAMDKSCKSPLDLKNSSAKWFPYNKGGSYRKWYGNNDFLVNWENDGQEMKDFTATLPQGTWVRLKSREFYCLPNITYSALSGGAFGCRLSEPGFLFDTKGSCIFADKEETLLALSALLNSAVCQVFLKILCPTLDYSMVGVKKLPAILINRTAGIAREATTIAKMDWDAGEESWDFQTIPTQFHEAATLKESTKATDAQFTARFARMKQLEEENNRLFIEAYGLENELSPDVADDQITLYRPNHEEDIKRLLSYSIGCMMGRYSLNKPGLIYAHSENNGFNTDQYKIFPADEDGIIPLVGTDWGIRDDAANRIVEFVGVAWPKETLEENLKFIADSLVPAKNEQTRDTIRRYLATGFYKHHLSMYKRRPIYWLFTSGKQRAFQCLVYLHRYHEGTLARMRTEYVIPLQGKITARIEQLNGDITQATSTSHRNKLQKEQTDLKKQQTELATFDEKLKHFADMRIKLDLDDGVKVNYGKFGDLLADVKAVTGGGEE